MDNCGVESLITCAAFQSTLDRYTLADIALSPHDFPQTPTPIGDSFSSNSLVSVCCSAMTGALQCLMMARSRSGSQP